MVNNPENHAPHAPNEYYRNVFQKYLSTYRGTRDSKITHEFFPDLKNLKGGDSGLKYVFRSITGLMEYANGFIKELELKYLPSPIPSNWTSSYRQEQLLVHLTDEEFGELNRVYDLASYIAESRLDKEVGLKGIDWERAERDKEGKRTVLVRHSDKKLTNYTVDLSVLDREDTVPGLDTIWSLLTSHENDKGTQLTHERSRLRTIKKNGQSHERGVPSCTLRRDDDENLFDFYQKGFGKKKKKYTSEDRYEIEVDDTMIDRIIIEGTALDGQLKITCQPLVSRDYLKRRFPEILKEGLDGRSSGAEEKKPVLKRRGSSRFGSRTSIYTMGGLREVQAVADKMDSRREEEKPKKEKPKKEKPKEETSKEEKPKKEKPKKGKPAVLKWFKKAKKALSGLFRDDSDQAQTDTQPLIESGSGEKHVKRLMQERKGHKTKMVEHVRNKPCSEELNKALNAIPIRFDDGHKVSITEYGDVTRKISFTPSKNKEGHMVWSASVESMSPKDSDAEATLEYWSGALTETDLRCTSSQIIEDRIIEKTRGSNPCSVSVGDQIRHRGTSV